MWFLTLVIQLRRGTRTARLTGASFCICKQQSETLGVSSTIVNQMGRVPFTHFSRAITQIITFCVQSQDLGTRCNLQLNGKLGYKGMSTAQQQRGSPYLHLLLLLLECWAWSSCRTTPSESLRHGSEISRLLDQGNNCWGLFNAKLVSSSNSNIPQFPFCLSSSSTSQPLYIGMQSLTLPKFQLSLQSQSFFCVPLVPFSSSSLAFVSKCPQIPGSFLQSYSPPAHILPQTSHINHPIGFLSHCSCLQHPTTKHCSLSLTETVIC